MNSNPDSSEYLKRVNAALALREIPDHLAAQSQLTRAAELAPNDASIYLLLGLTYQDLSQMDKAEANFRKAVELQPDLKEAQQAFGLTLVSNEKHGEAIPVLKSIAEIDPANLSVLQALAKAYEHEGLADDSFEIIERMLLLNPESKSLSQHLFMLTLKTGEFDRAKTILDQDILVHVTNDLLDLSGVICLLSDDFDGAISKFNDAIKLDEKSELSWGNLIQTYVILEKYDDAMKVVEAGLAKNPKSIPILSRKAGVLSSLGDPKSSIDLYSEVIESAIKSEHSLLKIILDDQMAVINTHYGQKAALEHLQNIISEFPEYFNLWKKMVLLLLRLELYSDAVTALDQISMNFPENKKLVVYSYEAFHGADYPEKAKQILDEEYQIVHDDSRRKISLLTTVESIGVRFYQRGLIEESKNIFEQVLLLDSSRARSINNLAFIYISNQNWDEALDLLSQAETQGYDEGGILEANRGYIFAHQRELDIALGSFLDAIKVAKDNDKALLHVAYPWFDGVTNESADNFPSRNVYIKTSILANLATVHYMMGDLEEAWEAAHQAVAFDPDESTGHRVLGCLHLLTKQYEEANKEWDLALHSNISDDEMEAVRRWIAQLTSR